MNSLVQGSWCWYAMSQCKNHCRPVRHELCARTLRYNIVPHMKKTVLVLDTFQHCLPLGRGDSLNKKPFLGSCDHLLPGWQRGGEWGRGKHGYCYAARGEWWRAHSLKHTSVYQCWLGTQLPNAHHRPAFIMHNSLMHLEWPQLRRTLRRNAIV